MTAVPNLPAHWQIVPLATVASLHTGAAINSNASLRDPVRLPYLRVKNVQDGCLDLDDIAEMEIERRNIARFGLQAGDVLLNAGGDDDKLGRGHIWHGQIDPCLHQNHVFAIRTDSSRLLPEYFSALVASQYGKTYFARCAKKTTNLASLTAIQMKAFPLLLPPLAEQVAIVALLADFDAAIANRVQVLSNCQQQWHSWMAQLFSPAQHPTLQPQDWQRLPLGALAASTPNGFDSATPKDAAFRYIELKHVKDGRISADLPGFTRETAPSRAQRKVVPGAILLATVRPGLHSFARATEAHSDCIASSGFAVLHAKPGVDAGFLYHSLYTAPLQQQLQQYAEGTSYPQISQKNVLRMQLDLPPLAAQIGIAEILDDVQQKIQCEQTSLALLRQQRATVLEQVVLGQVRLV